MVKGTGIPAAQRSGSQIGVWSAKGLTLVLYLASIYNVIMGFIALFRGGDWITRFASAAVAFVIAFVIWRRLPAHQYWDLPEETLRELKQRLGWQFPHLERLAKDGLIPDKLFMEGSDIEILVPNLVFALSMLSIDLVRGGRLQDAEETVRLALRLDSDAVAAKISLAVILAETGRMEEALPYAKDSLRGMGQDDPYNFRPVLEEIVRKAQVG